MMSTRFFIQFFSVFFICSGIFASSAKALYTELGINYAYKKNYFDTTNYQEQQSTQGSVSFYLWERIALELSYTTGLNVQKEKQPNTFGAVLRTTTMYFDAYGSDLIFVFADKKAQIQPYIKGGAAQINRKIVIQDDGNNPWEIVYSGLSMSYGAGIKVFFTESFAIRGSYDVLQSPSNNDTKYNETNGRIGLSWML